MPFNRKAAHLCPRALRHISPVADPASAANAGVPLLVGGEVGGEVHCVLPALGSIATHRTQWDCARSEGRQQRRRREGKSYPGLARFSAALIHVPVALPLPAAGRQLEAVQRLGVDAGDVAPRPAVGGQQGVGEAVHRVPPLWGHRGGAALASACMRRNSLAVWYSNPFCFFNHLERTIL